MSHLQVLKERLFFLKYRLIQIVFVICVAAYSNVVYGQSGLCDPTVPYYECNLSGQPAGSWISNPPVVRKGNCCGTTAPDRCIEFKITLDPSAIAINFNIASGAVPGGAMFYQIDCGPPVAVGEPICLNGPGPYTLTFCKPGNNLNTYEIVSIPGPSLSPPDTTSQGCSATATAYGLIPSSITWTTIAPGTQGQYNSFLSATSGVSTINVTPTGTTYPPYVDVKVCGTPAANDCLGSSSYCDTVRIYFNPPINNTVTPNPAVFCSSQGGINLTGAINGGVAPYQAEWTNENNVIVATGTSFYATVPGIYSFIVKDANYPGCPQKVTAVTVSEDLLPVLNAGSDKAVCADRPIQLNGTATNTTTYEWQGGAGVFDPDRNTLNATYNPTPTEIANGSVTLTLVSTSVNACPAVSDQITFTLKPPLNLTLNGPNIMCYGQSYNLTTLVSGGTPPYSYLWNTGQTASSLNNITPGSYSVQVTDATPNGGCTATANLNINQNPEIIVDAVPSSLVSCDVTVPINAVASGGSGGFSYLWSNGSNSSSINVFSGTYTVWVTDAVGCRAQDVVTVSAPNSTLTSQITGATSVCYGLTTSLTASAAGGFGNYSYQWSNGAGNVQTVTVPYGNYCVDITDDAGCKSTACTQITEIPPLQVTVTAPQFVCSGANALISAQVTNGTGSYSYSWSTGSFSNSISVQAGTYTVIATGPNGCTGTATVTVNEEPVLTVATGSDPVTCFGLSTGSVNATANGGIAPYSYSWSYFGLGSTVVNNLQAGSYTVVVTDALGCNVTGTVTLTQPNPLSISVPTKTNVSCFGGSNGSAVSNVTGGTNPYQYTWSTGGSSPNETNLSAGTYNVQVTDAEGCISSISFSISQPQVLSGNITTLSPIICRDQASGSFGVSSTGGTSPYTYTWSTNPVQYGSTINNLAPGSYSVTIVDANGCNASASATLTNPQALNAFLLNQTNVSCFGGNNGSATVSVTGGVSPYTYGWSNGNPNQTSAANLVSGSYQVNVTDALGCTQNVSFTITQPAQALSIDLGNDQTINCLASVNILASPIGGTSPYTYTWNTGSSLNNINVSSSGSYSVEVTDVNGCIANDDINVALLGSDLSVSIQAPTFVCVNGTDTVFAVVTGGNSPYTYSWTNGDSDTNTIVGEGQYCVYITDNLGCKVSDCVTLNEESAISVTNLITKACYNSNGTISPLVTGGINPFSYSWSNSSTGNTLSGPPGNYSLTVSDALGCSVSKPAQINATSEISLTLLGKDNVACFGGNDGSISVAASGGTSPYSYSWSNNETTSLIYGLSVGTYSVVVADSLGCTKTFSYNITEPVSELNLNYTKEDALCYLNQNGEIAIQITGGTPAYSSIWNTGDTTKTVTNLGAGAYTVYINDLNGCVKSQNVTINQPNVLDVKIDSVRNVRCFGTTTGYADAYSQGGTNPYTYSWSNGVTGNVNSNIGSGTYWVYTTDLNGCRDSVKTVITQPTKVNFSYIKSDAICLSSNGAISVNSISGGVSPYLVSWSNSVNGLSNPNLAPANYIVTITDANLCVLKDTITVLKNNLQLNLSLNKIDINCKEQANGSVSVNITNGQLPFTYNWSNGAITPGVSPIPAGEYSVEVIDANGCEAIDSAEVIIKYPVDVITATPAPSCSGDTIILSAQGGINYSWYANDSTFLNAGPQTIVTPTSTNVYTVVGYNTLCTDTVKINAIVNTKPNINAGNDTAHCKNSFVQLNVTGGISYTWSPLVGLNDYYTDNPIATGNQTIQYFVKGFDINGCSNVDTINVGALNLPTVFLNITDSVCTGSNATLSAGGGVSYSWSPSAFLSSSNGQSVTANPVNTTNYTLVVTNVAGCVKDSTFKLTVIQPANINISGNSPICKGDSVPLTASGANTYSWYPSEGISSINSSNTYITPDSTMYYYVVGFIKNCPSTDSVLVTVKPLPSVNAGADLNICFGGTTTLNGNSSGTYQWSPSVGLSNPSISNPDANPTQSTYYILTATGANGCTDTSGAWVVVNPLPNASFTATKVCMGNTTVFTNNSSISSGNIVNYFWNFGDTIGNSQIVSPTYAYDTCGNYTATLVATSDKGCVGIQSKIAQVYCLPIVQFSLSDSTLCEGQQVNLQNFSFLTTSVKWHFGDGDSSIVPNPTHSYDSAAYYQISLIGTNANGCKDTVTKEIVVNEKPLADFTPEDVCFGGVTNFNDLTSVTSGSITGWDWDFGSLGSSSQKNPTVIFPTTGNFQIQLIATSNIGCSDTANKTVRVYPGPDITVTAGNACLGNPNNFITQVIGSPAVTKWLWDFDQDGIYDDSIANPQFIYPNPGMQLIEMIGVGTNGCKDTQIVIVNVYSAPLANFNSTSSNACPPVCFTFKDSSSINGVGIGISNYQWLFNGVPVSTDSAPSICVNESGKYNVGLIVTSTQGCKSDTTTKINYVEAYPIPVSDFTFTPEQPSLINSAISFFENTIDAKKWYWNFGDKNELENFSSERDPTHVYSDTGSYCVNLIAENGYGCKDTSEKCFYVKHDFVIYIPNAFTPDGSKLNEIFAPKGIGFYEQEDYILQIFDRWGNLIFTSKDYRIGWNGSVKESDEPGQQDVYVYRLKVKEIATGDKHSFTGTVTMVR